eukprot:scaffold8377_cov58-Phaeocystis_antarctica.AAC.4
MTAPAMMSWTTPARRSSTSAAVHLPPPSSVLFGAQHKRMLEATQARIPQIAPTMPGMPPARPVIEKTEEKTKQAMTMHLALLASLGKLGLSEHMLEQARSVFTAPTTTYWFLYMAFGGGFSGIIASLFRLPCNSYCDWLLHVTSQQRE